MNVPIARDARGADPLRGLRMSWAIRAALAALSLGLGGLAQAFVLTPGRGSLATWLFLAATAGLSLAFRGQAPEPASGNFPRWTPSRSTRRTGVALALLGLGLAVLACVLITANWNRFLLRAYPAGLAGLLLLALGLDLAAGYGRRWIPRLPAGWSRQTWWEAGVLAIILAAGLFFRFRSFGEFPPFDGFHSIEETQGANVGWRIIRGSRPWEWMSGMYLPAASFAVFGRSMEALRVPGTLLHWLSLVPAYFLYRRVTGVPAALFGAALLAVSRWHVQTSWNSDNALLPLPAFIVLLWLLFRAREDPRPTWFVAIGALIGASLYSYPAFRAVPLLVLVFFALSLRRGPRRALAGGFALAFLIGSLYVPPLLTLLKGEQPGYYFEALGRSMANRGYYTDNTRRFVTLRLERIEHAAESLIATDKAAFSPRLNTGAAPLLDPYTSVFFVLGFGTTLAFITRRDHFFLAGAFVMLGLGATTLVHNLDFRRLAIMIPFAFFFPCLLARKLLALPGPRAVRYAALGLLAVTALLAARFNFSFLFETLARNMRVRAEHRNAYTVPGFYLHRHHGGEYVFLVSPPNGYPVGNFFDRNDYDWLKPDGLEGRVVSTLEEALAPERKAAGRGTLVLMVWPLPFEESVARVRQLHPDAQCEIRPDPDSNYWSLAACRFRSESGP